MVWVVEKKVVRHLFDTGLERIEIPVRVKFECGGRGGTFIPQSPKIDTLHNHRAIERRFPGSRDASSKTPLIER